MSTSPLASTTITWVPASAHGVHITVHHPHAMALSMLPPSPLFMQSNTAGGVCRAQRLQANQRWLPLAPPVPTKPIKEYDIKKPKHAYPWEDQCTHLAAVWVCSCTIVSQDAAVFCLNLLL